MNQKVKTAKFTHRECVLISSGGTQLPCHAHGKRSLLYLGSLLFIFWTCMYTVNRHDDRTWNITIRVYGMNCSMKECCHYGYDVGMTGCDRQSEFAMRQCHMHLRMKKPKPRRRCAHTSCIMLYYNINTLYCIHTWARPFCGWFDRRIARIIVVSTLTLFRHVF